MPCSGWPVHLMTWYKLLRNWLGAKVLGRHEAEGARGHWAKRAMTETRLQISMASAARHDQATMGNDV